MSGPDQIEVSLVSKFKEWIRENCSSPLPTENSFYASIWNAAIEAAAEASKCLNDLEPDQNPPPCCLSRHHEYCDKGNILALKEPF